MRKLSRFAVMCVALGLGTSSVAGAEAPPDAPVEAAPLSAMQEADDVLEVLLLPLEAVRLGEAGVSDEEVKLAVAVFKEAGMSPGEAAGVVRLEEALSKRRGVRAGFGQYVMKEVAEGKAPGEIARSLREREDVSAVDAEAREALMEAVKARRKAELAKVVAMRARVKDKRARGERVMIRGQMRLRGVTQQDRREALVIDVPWLEKRLMRVQQRMIRLDQQRARLDDQAGKKGGKGRSLARAEGLKSQRERLLAERRQLTEFITRMKELDADGRLEGSARDTLIDEIKTAFRIDDRPPAGPAMELREMPRGPDSSGSPEGGSADGGPSKGGSGKARFQPGESDIRPADDSKGSLPGRKMGPEAVWGGDSRGSEAAGSPGARGHGDEVPGGEKPMAGGHSANPLQEAGKQEAGKQGAGKQGAGKQGAGAGGNNAPNNVDGQGHGQGHKKKGL